VTHLGRQASPSSTSNRRMFRSRAPWPVLAEARQNVVLERGRRSPHTGPLILCPCFVHEELQDLPPQARGAPVTSRASSTPSALYQGPSPDAILRAFTGVFALIYVVLDTQVSMKTCERRGLPLRPTLGNAPSAPLKPAEVPGPCWLSARDEERRRSCGAASSDATRGSRRWHH